jgi:DNA-binding NarL/FixJ family response regulator
VEAEACRIRKGIVRMPINLLLADSHTIFRETLKAMLQQQEGLCVIADTDDGAQAVEICAVLLPEVAILEIILPNLDGVAAMRKIVANGLTTKVIILSQCTDQESIAAALSAGAKGYLAKTCNMAELVFAIQRVVAGDYYLSATISAGLVRLITTPLREVQHRLPPGDNRLSRRENQVLKLLAEGNGTKEVAALLSLSTKSIETYRLNLMKKLNILNMANLVRYAIRTGIADLT